MTPPGRLSLRLALLVGALGALLAWWLERRR